jgi:flagellar basal body P-ring formation protein FlgA
MMRLFALIVAALLLPAWPAAAATLVPFVTVTGPAVHVGDIFAGAGAHAAETAAAAPPAGTRITYGADWLAAVAREHGLDWTPGSSMDQVTIVRASKVIDSDAIAKELMHEIAQRQSVDDAELELDNPGLSIVVPAEAQGMAVDGLTIDRRSGRISAFVMAPAGDPAAVRRQVTGRLIYRVAVPVLTHSMAPGATIAAGDVEMLKLHQDRVPPASASDAAQLIGKTPRRALAPEQPVQLADLLQPLLVHRDDLVTVVLEIGNLRLTSQAKALEDGAAGAVVRVKNTASSRVIDATVLAPGVVGVASGGTLAQQVAEQ